MIKIKLIKGSLFREGNWKAFLSWGGKNKQVYRALHESLKILTLTKYCQSLKIFSGVSANKTKPKGAVQLVSGHMKFSCSLQVWYPIWGVLTASNLIKLPANVPEEVKEKDPCVGCWNTWMKLLPSDWMKLWPQRPLFHLESEPLERIINLFLSLYDFEI